MWVEHLRMRCLGVSHMHSFYDASSRNYNRTWTEYLINASFRGIYTSFVFIRWLINVLFFPVKYEIIKSRFLLELCYFIFFLHLSTQIQKNAEVRSKFLNIKPSNTISGLFIWLLVQGSLWIISACYFLKV